MKTQAEEMGLAVGDKVEVTGNSNRHNFHIQDTVKINKLYEESALCESLPGDAWYVAYSDMRPLKKSPKKQGIKPYKKQAYQQVGIKGALADFFHQLEGMQLYYNDDSDEAYEITGDSTITVKIKGKEVNPKDIKITIEG